LGPIPGPDFAGDSAALLSLLIGISPNLAIDRPSRFTPFLFAIGHRDHKIYGYIEVRF
jgi:hypothetical protein